MTCSHCHAVLNSEMAFCPACGQSAAPVDRAFIREENIRTLSSTITYFLPLQDLFDRYDRMGEVLLRYSRGARKSLLVWGCILATLGLSFLLITIDDPASRSRLAEELLPVLFILLLPGLAMIGGGIGMIVNNHRKRTRALEEYRQLYAAFSPYLSSAPTDVVGISYCNPRILTHLLSLLQYGHADTAKEALNLCLPAHKQSAIQQHFFRLRSEVSAVELTPPLVFLPARFFTGS